MSLVIDASVTLAWYFEDESTAETDAIQNKVADFGAIVPLHWRLEVGNAFQSALRRKRITAHYAEKALQQLAKISIKDDAETNAHAWAAIFELAKKYNLTTYDAAYLERALRLKLPLATLDKDLRKAARSAGVALADNDR